MTEKPTIELAAFHLNSEDRGHLYDMSDIARLRMVEIRRTSEGWSLTFNPDVEPGTLVGFNSSKGIFRSYLWDLMDEGVGRLIISERGPINPALPIYHPTTDEVVPSEGFTGQFDPPTFDYLVEKAMAQVARYPQYKPEMFDGWKVGRAETDIETKMGLAILEGEYSLYRDSGEDCRFWSFRNRVQTGIYAGTFSESVFEAAPTP